MSLANAPLFSGFARAASLIGAAAALTACASSASFDGHVYRGGGMELSAGPEGRGWSKLETSHGLMAFRDEAQRATILVNGRCGKDGDDVPLSALTAHLFLQFTERAIESEETIPFDGREARRTLLSAKLDGVPLRFEAFVMKKDGCVYDFILMSEPGTFDAERGAFDAFVAGFHVIKP
jgi:hypothetical protein